MDHQPIAVEEVAGRRVLFVMATDHEYGSCLRARIRPLVTGVGPIEAAAATGAALATLAAGAGLPDLVVCLGSAGSRRVAVGTVVQVASVSWRDIDATRLGFARGITPFLDRPATIVLPTPLDGVPTATLSTGATVVGGADYAAIDADLVDMESFAVLRACERFGVAMIGLRGVSDGPGELDGIDGWTGLLSLLDRNLAEALDGLPAAFETVCPSTHGPSVRPNR